VLRQLRRELRGWELRSADGAVDGFLLEALYYFSFILVLFCVFFFFFRRRAEKERGGRKSIRKCEQWDKKEEKRGQLENAYDEDKIDAPVPELFHALDQTLRRREGNAVDVCLSGRGANSRARV
jgi:hypothetical protein